MTQLQALSIIWIALFDYRESVIREGDEANDDSWSEITHAMAILHESLDIAQEDID